jgi:hypothetical protein
MGRPSAFRTSSSPLRKFEFHDFECDLHPRFESTVCIEPVPLYPRESTQLMGTVGHFSCTDSTLSSSSSVRKSAAYCTDLQSCELGERRFLAETDSSVKPRRYSFSEAIAQLFRQSFTLSTGFPKGADLEPPFSFRGPWYATGAVAPLGAPSRCRSAYGATLTQPAVPVVPDGGPMEWTLSAAARSYYGTPGH